MPCILSVLILALFSLFGTEYWIDSEGSQLFQQRLEKNMNISRDSQKSLIELFKNIPAMGEGGLHDKQTNSVCKAIYCYDLSNDSEQNNTSSVCVTIPMLSLTSYDDNLTEFSAIKEITKNIHLYIYPIFIFIGIFGNILSCLTMLINIRRHGYPASLYLTLLAFIDFVFLLGSALPEWVSQINNKFDLRLLSDYSCRFVYWYGNFITHLSAGLVVAVTVERFIAVQYPLIAHKLNTVTRTRSALIIIFTFFFLLDMPILIFVGHRNETVYIIYTCENDTLVRYERQYNIRCKPTHEGYQKTWPYVDFAFYTLIPFLTIATLNFLIVRRLIDAQRFRQRMFKFNNYTQNSTTIYKYDENNAKYGQISEKHQMIEMIEKNLRDGRQIHMVRRKKSLTSKLQERRQRFSTKQSSISTEISTLSFEIKPRSNFPYETSSVRHHQGHFSNSKNKRLTVLLLFISWSYLLLTLPSVVFNLIITYRHETKLVRKMHNVEPHLIFYFTLTRLLMIVNHSIHFILYFVLGKRFRRDLRQLFIAYCRKLC